jgi:Mn-containing catalase
MCHHVKKLMYTVDVGEPDPRCGKMFLEQFGGAIGLIEPTPKFLDQYFNTSTGEGDYGEKDLLGPWNEEDVERVDAAALQSFLDPKIGTRASEPSDAPDLAAPKRRTRT